MTNFVHFCLDLYRHFNSLRLQWEQGTNIPVCIQECGCFLPLAKWLGAAVVKVATVFPDPASVPSLPGAWGNIFQSTFFPLSERQNTPWIPDRSLKMLLNAAVCSVARLPCPLKAKTAPTDQPSFQPRRTSSLVQTQGTTTSLASLLGTGVLLVMPFYLQVCWGTEQQPNWKLHQVVICSRRRDCQSEFP